MGDKNPNKPMKKKKVVENTTVDPVVGTEKELVKKNKK